MTTTQPTLKGETMSEKNHKAEVMAEITNLTSREEIQNRMDSEDNTTVKIWIWQYMQTL